MLIEHGFYTLFCRQVLTVGIQFDVNFVDTIVDLSVCREVDAVRRKITEYPQRCWRLTRRSETRTAFWNRRKCYPVYESVRAALRFRRYQPPSGLRKRLHCQSGCQRYYRFAENDTSEQRQAKFPENLLGFSDRQILIHVPRPPFSSEDFFQSSQHNP